MFVDYNQSPFQRPAYYDISMYGNYNVAIKNTKSINEENSSYTTPNSDIKIYSDIAEINHNVGNDDFSNIEQYVQDNIDSQFNLEKFAYNEVETFDGSNDSLITFRYMIDDFRSDFGYNVINHNVVEIVKVGHDLYKSSIRC